MIKQDKIIRTVEGRAMPFLEDDVDTDVIIPSRYLATITWDDVGKGLLWSRRYSQDGKPLENSVLNDPTYAGAKLLLAGNNFGCGSSREHAPQAIKCHFDGIIAISYAGIFDGNCYAIGLPAVRVSPENMQLLLTETQTNPITSFKLDLEKKVISYDKKTISIDINEINRQGFLTGNWDERDTLVGNLEKVRARAKRSLYVNNYSEFTV